MGIIEGFLGFVILVLDVWAIVKTLSSTASPLAKALWIVIIIFLPVVGLVLWLLLGPKGR